MRKAKRMATALVAATLSGLVGFGCGAGARTFGEGPPARGGGGGAAPVGAAGALASGGQAAAGAGGNAGGRPGVKHGGDGGGASSPPEEGGLGGEHDSVGQAGSASAAGGASGESSAGQSGDAGEPSAGSAGAGGIVDDDCGCDAAHDCVSGACVMKPECDCSTLRVACGPLSAALHSDFACPIEVECGNCPDGSLCAGTNNEALFGRRVCVVPNDGECKPWTTYDAVHGWPPLCPGVAGDARCSVVYSACATISLPTGEVCPAAASDPSLAAYCGPAL